MILDYRSFMITEDEMLGWSLIGPSGQWNCSMTSKEKLMEVVDEVLDKQQ